MILKSGLDQLKLRKEYHGYLDYDVIIKKFKLLKLKVFSWN